MDVLNRKNSNFIITNHYDNIFNYEEILIKETDEDKRNLNFDSKSPKFKGKKKKNVEIYISDEGDKDYDPYKIEFDYLQNLQKEYLKTQFLAYLKNEKKEKTENNQKSCCNFCCLI